MAIAETLAGRGSAIPAPAPVTGQRLGIEHLGIELLACRRCTLMWAGQPLKPGMAPHIRLVDADLCPWCSAGGSGRTESGRGLRIGDAVGLASDPESANSGTVVDFVYVGTASPDERSQVRVYWRSSCSASDHRFRDLTRGGTR
ncbi:hypothetical protein [Mycolicibacterium vaccae]|uniref:hypothetical protein n=1 Tax=Mycolicibacterium vaccae TaxID=1810 RepID=UPI003D04CEBB